MPNCTVNLYFSGGIKKAHGWWPFERKKAPSLKRFACELGHGQRVPQSFNMVSYGTPCSVLAFLLMNDRSIHLKVVFLFGQVPTQDNGYFLKIKITHVLIIAIILPKSYRCLQCRPISIFLFHFLIKFRHSQNYIYGKMNGCFGKTGQQDLHKKVHSFSTFYGILLRNIWFPGWNA